MSAHDHQSGLQRMSRLPRWRNKWVGFYCAAIFRQTLIQSVEGRATLIQRNSDCCSGTLDDKCTGCTKQDWVLGFGSRSECYAR